MLKTRVSPTNKDDVVNAMAVAAGNHPLAVQLTDFYSREAQLCEIWECKYRPPMYSRQRFDEELEKYKIHQTAPEHPVWWNDEELQACLVSQAEDYEEYCELLNDVRRQTKHHYIVKMCTPPNLPSTTLTTSLVPTRSLDRFQLKDNLANYYRFSPSPSRVAQILCFSALQTNQFWLGLEAIRSVYFAQRMLRSPEAPLDVTAMIEGRDLASELLNDAMDGTLFETLTEIPLNEMCEEEKKKMNMVAQKVLEQAITDIFGETINPIENNVRRLYVRWEVSGRRHQGNKKKLLLLNSLQNPEEQQN